MFTSALGIIGGVLAAAVLLGAAYAAFRASDLRSTVADQKKRIDSLLVDRAETQRELEEEKQVRQLMEKRLDLAEDRVKNLEEIVSGRIDFSALETALAHHHEEAVRRVDQLRADVLTAVGDVKGLLSARRTGEVGDPA